MTFLDIETVEKLEDIMMETLSTSRYRHCFAVAETAATLAYHWGVDEHTAFDAGLLHDMMHYLPDDQMLAKAQEYHLPIDAGARANPMLLHGPLAAAILEQDYGCDNQQMLDAIRYHTVANPQMDEVAKIIYLSDMIEPGRPNWPGLAKLRALSMMDLDMAMVYAMESTIDYLAQRGQQPHPDTEKILAVFRDKVAQKTKWRQHMSESRSAQEILEQCRKLAEEKKARDISVIPLEGKTLISDYFLIVTAGSNRQAQSISDAIELAMKEAGTPPLRIEGYSEARWILLDLGVVVVHIFQDEERAYYDLERLWAGPEGAKQPEKDASEQ